MKAAFVVLNPVAGSLTDAGRARRVIERQLSSAGWTVDLYQTTGDEDEHLPTIVRRALERASYDLVIAAGGDGTVSAVAAGVVDDPTGGSKAGGAGTVPLGLLPVGTGNGLARHIGLPLGVEPALDLILGQHAVRPIDAMRVATEQQQGVIAILNASTGVSPQIVRRADHQQKRQLGRLAYVWSGLDELLRPPRHRFRVTVDGEVYPIGAVEVFIANGGLTGHDLLKQLTTVELDDGRIDVCILSAASFDEILQVGWEIASGAGADGGETPVLCLQASQRVVIEGLKEEDKGLLVQADGELIGRLPLAIDVLERALPLIVPP